VSSGFDPLTGAPTRFPGVLRELGVEVIVEEEQR
jgi:hypothetical protein